MVLILFCWFYCALKIVNKLLLSDTSLTLIGAFTGLSSSCRHLIGWSLKRSAMFQIDAGKRFSSLKIIFLKKFRNWLRNIFSYFYCFRKKDEPLGSLDELNCCLVKCLVYPSLVSVCSAETEKLPNSEFPIQTKRRKTKRRKSHDKLWTIKQVLQGALYVKVIISLPSVLRSFVLTVQLSYCL